MSFGEIIITLLVALIVIGPKKLPTVAHFLGKAYVVLNNYRQKLSSFWENQEAHFKLEKNLEKAAQAEKEYEAKNTP